MTIYESNFIKLGNLVAGIETFSGAAVSRSPRDCDLYLELLRREPYTTTLKLTYRFADTPGREIADPDLILRVYHDARLVEAVRGSIEHRHAKLKELSLPHTAELSRRWRSNMLLNKWLDYVTDMGHTFR
jgi:uncharacterized protein YqiB (DUF1249 family)